MENNLQSLSMIKNRLEKNYKKLKAWADRNKIEAYRLYDRDIPEFPFIVDIYKNQYLVYDKSESIIDENKNHLPLVIESLKILFKIPETQIIVKKRERQEGTKQYEKIDTKDESFIVRESQALLKINLHDYLDTGLFLDHRPMRQKIFKQSKGKSVLNLFCYTGSVSVFAALAGGITTNVDMSNTYMKWAMENFEINQIKASDHEFIVANALDWLESNHEKTWDLIFLDPPTFSNSKKMSDNFDVERDQVGLIESTMRHMNSDGVLYFSNNKRKFKLAKQLSEKFQIRDITEESIPQDFHDKKIHQCFEIKLKDANVQPIENDRD